MTPEKKASIKNIIKKVSAAIVIILLILSIKSIETGAWLYPEYIGTPLPMILSIIFYVVLFTLIYLCSDSKVPLIITLIFLIGLALITFLNIFELPQFLKLIKMLLGVAMLPVFLPILYIEGGIDYIILNGDYSIYKYINAHPLIILAFLAVLFVPRIIKYRQRKKLEKEETPEISEVNECIETE